MASSEKAKPGTISKTALRKALAGLKPPTGEMLLGGGMARWAPRFDELFKQGKYEPGELHSLLDGLAQEKTLFTHESDHLSVTVPIGVAIDWGPIVHLPLLENLYLPVDSPPEWVPPEHRYSHSQVQEGAGGGASADIGSGKLTSAQNVNVSSTLESTWAGVFITLETDPANFGRMSRLMFDPQIDWSGRDILDFQPSFIDRLDGYIWFTYRIWVGAYLLDPETGEFSNSPGTSPIGHQVMSGFWHINSGGMFANSGSLRNGAAEIQLDVSSSQTYLLGVWTEMGVRHNLRNVDGGPIPQPGSGEFVSYGLLKAEVPKMWVRHVVLS